MEKLENNTMYENSAVSELNKVTGFNPLNFIKNAVLIRKQRMCPVAVTSVRTHPLCLFPGKGTVWL